MHREKKRGPASELEEARTERFLGDLNFDRRRSFLGREMRDDEDKYECLESFEEEAILFSTFPSRFLMSEILHVHCLSEWSWLDTWCGGAF